MADGCAGIFERELAFDRALMIHIQSRPNGVLPSISHPTDRAAIGQTGQIPNDASSLLFLRSANSGFQVSFGGNNIPMVQLGTSGNNIIMAGNISRFAGQTGQLLFAGGGLFDNIQFSYQAIPEPSVLGLSVIGGLLLAWRVIETMESFNRQRTSGSGTFINRVLKNAFSPEKRCKNRNDFGG